MIDGRIIKVYENGINYDKTLTERKKERFIDEIKNGGELVKKTAKLNAIKDNIKEELEKLSNDKIDAFEQNNSDLVRSINKREFELTEQLKNFNTVKNEKGIFSRIFNKLKLILNG